VESDPPDGHPEPLYEPFGRIKFVPLCENKVINTSAVAVPFTVTVPSPLSVKVIPLAVLVV